MTSDDRKTPVPDARDTRLPYDVSQDAELSEMDARITTVVATHARRQNVALLLGVVAIVIAVASLAVAAQPSLHRPASPSTVTQTCPEVPACPACPAAPACPAPPSCPACPSCPPRPERRR